MKGTIHYFAIWLHFSHQILHSRALEGSANLKHHCLQKLPNQPTLQPPAQSSSPWGFPSPCSQSPRKARECSSLCWGKHSAGGSGVSLTLPEEGLLNKKQQQQNNTTLIQRAQQRVKSVQVITTTLHPKYKKHTRMLQLILSLLAHHCPPPTLPGPADLHQNALWGSFASIQHYRLTAHTAMPDA